MNNLDLLGQVVSGDGGGTTDTHRWATVTDDSPLTIQLDGDTAPLPFVPDNCVAGLAIDDRVFCVLTSGGPKTFQGRRVTIIGKSQA